VNVVPIPIDKPDVSAEIQAELGANKPGLVQVIGDAPFCGKVMRALDTAGYTGKIVIIPTCIESGNTNDLPGLKGSIMLATNSTDPKQPEVKLYNAVMDTYAGKKADKGTRAVAGYQSVVGFARAMKGLQGDLTPDSVKSTIAAMPPTPYPIADGITFQCNKTQVSIAPNICSNAVLQTTLDAKGNGTKYTTLDGSNVLKLG
jgi:branched-chain amino acid transport system substrate-binding protein